MSKNILCALVASLFTSSALAGGGIGYSATDGDGTVERVIEQRGLSDGMVGAMVSYERSDGSRSLVEYAVKCDPLSYAYLGIVDENPNATPNPLTARNASDQILSNALRPVELIPIGESEAAIGELVKAVCS